MKEKRFTKLIGSGMLLATAMIWGMAFAFQRSAMDGCGPYTFGAARMTLAAAFVWLLILIRRIMRKAEKEELTQTERAFKRKNTLLGGMLCGLFLFAGTTLQQLGLIYTSAGKSGFLTALYIVLVPLASLVVLGKKQGPLVWAGVAFGAAGLYFLCINESFSVNKGDLFTIGCAAVFAVQIMCCSWFAPKGDTLMISGIQIAACALLSFVFAAIFEKPELSALQSCMPAIIYCGVFSGGIGYTLQLFGQKYADPTAASMLMSFEAVFAVLGGVVLLNEKLTAKELTGCILMFIAVILVQLPSPAGRAKGVQNGN